MFEGLTIAAITSVFVAILNFGGPIIAAYVIWRLKRIETNVEQIHIATNSMKDALVATTLAKGLAQGEIVGQEKEEAKSKAAAGE